MKSWQQWGIIIVLGLGGMGLVGYGVWEQLKPRGVVVEIVKSEQGNQEFSEQQVLIVVDVGGAVEKPGVYKLKANSRIGEALVAAGGLSADADREWVATTLNLAEKIEDGEKVYIPLKDRKNNQTLNTSSQTGGGESKNSNLININQASISELDSLEGIGEVRARAIIDNRPYSKTEEIVAKAKVPESTYEKIRDKLSVY